MGDGVVVETDRGRVRGSEEIGVLAFLGIPYAEAPIGNRRFRAPVVRRWSGVRDAQRLGPSSIQAAPPAGARGTPLSGILGETVRPGMSEDCLTCNVWSADLEGHAPVMVWLHGGGYTSGSASAAVTDGTRLARGHGVVVVSVNHRLGLLGFLDVTEVLDADKYRGSANASLLDLVAALIWVRDNITAFGGDPSRVTIFGCSGGGGKIGSLLAMPEARGLFHRAIIESGPLFSIRDRDAARETTRSVLDVLGARAEDLAELPAERLYEAQVALGAGGGPSERGMSFAPTVDGDVLPDQPERLFAAGHAADVPVIMGTNRDEARFSLAVAPRLVAAPEFGDNELARLLAPGFDGDPRPVIDRYRARDPEISNAELRLLLETEQFRIRTIREAEVKIAGGTAPVFCYRMDWASPALAHCGACHALEVPLVFSNCANAPALADDPHAHAVSAALSTAWTSFAATGLPTAPDGLVWDPYRPDSRATMIIDGRWRIEHDPMSEERRAWDDQTLSPATRPWALLVERPRPVRVA